MAFPINLPVLDTLAGTDANPLDGPWTEATAWWGAPLRRISNQGASQPSPNYYGASVYTGSQFTPPFIISSVIDVLPPADGNNTYNYEFYTTSPAVDGSPDGYDVIIRGGGGDYDLEVWHVVGGAYTAMNGVVGVAIQAGDALAVRYLQNLISVWRIRAGVWTELVNTDTSAFAPQYLGPFYFTIGITDSAGATPGITRFTNVAGADLTTFTRGYPTQASPEENVVGPSPNTWNAPFAWNQIEATFLLAESKTNGGVATAAQYNTNQQGNYDARHSRHITRPLAAQTISGTFDLCAFVQAVWVDPIVSPTNDSVVRFRVEVYVTVGQTAEKRATLLSYVDSVDWPGVGAMAWRSLSAAQALTATACLDGDSVMVEFGARVISSPTPAPHYPPPLPPGSNYTSAPFRFFGTTNTSNVALTDATAGSTTPALAPWVEFSSPLVLLPPGAAPANDACADTVVIASLPYLSPRISTSYSTGTQKEVWYSFVVTQTGRIGVFAGGSNYLVQLDAARGANCGSLSFRLPVQRLERFVATTQSCAIWDVTAGETWWFRIRNKVPSAVETGARESGGSLQIRIFMIEEPQTDDLILPCGTLGVFREGQMIAFTAAFFSSFPTGVAIDYTGRPMNSLTSGVNTNWRLLVALFGSDLVEIIDLPTLSVGEAEVDYIDRSLATNFSPGVPVHKHPSTLHITPAGLLTVAFFGNGFLYIDGYGTGIPAQLNTIASDAALYGGMRVLQATDGDNQPGAPFTASVLTPTTEITNPWAISQYASSGVFLYTSGSLYLPVGGMEIRRVTTGGAQLPGASLTLQPGANPGVRGLVALSDGGALVCNSICVQRLNSAGAVVGTYTPSLSNSRTVLMDVKVTSDGTAAWVVDLATNVLFKFQLSDMSELLVAETDMLPGTLTQMAIVQPIPPPPECPGRRSRVQIGA